MLHEIFKARECDKHFHGYATLYELIETLHYPKSILEIGVCKGASMMSWRDRFQSSELVGLDIDISNIEATPTDPYTLFHGDFRNYPINRKFDWIIDDGSHERKDVIAAFDKFWNYIEPGGFYIIEDLHCAFWHNWIGFINDIINEMTHKLGFELNRSETGFVIQQKSIIAIQKR